MADEELLRTILAQLQPLGIETRRLFGSHGLYHEGKMFGFLAGGRLYFRTDDSNRSDYVVRGMPAFQPPNRPRGPRTVDRNFEVPPEIMAAAGAIIAWAEKAIAASRTVVRAASPPVATGKPPWPIDDFYNK